MPRGRPVKYKDTEQIQQKIDEYFDWCDSQERIIPTDKGIIVRVKPYTVSGLCVHLGITRETLRQYEDREDLSDTIKMAKARIENYIEEKSLIGDLNPTVCIFNLKNNFGWRDRQEIDQSISNKDGQPFKQDVTLAGLSTEELRKLAKLDK